MNLQHEPLLRSPVVDDDYTTWEFGCVTAKPEVETDGRGGATMSLQGRNTH